MARSPQVPGVRYEACDGLKVKWDQNYGAEQRHRMRWQAKPIFQQEPEREFTEAKRLGHCRYENADENSSDNAAGIARGSGASKGLARVATLFHCQVAHDPICDAFVGA